MKASRPACFFVTFDAETRVDVRHHQEVAKAVVVRVMTTGALHLARMIERYFPW
jgi:hypothetical protein